MGAFLKAPTAGMTFFGSIFIGPSGKSIFFWAVCLAPGKDFLGHMGEVNFFHRSLTRDIFRRTICGSISVKNNPCASIANFFKCLYKSTDRFTHIKLFFDN